METFRKATDYDGSYRAECEGREPNSENPPRPPNPKPGDGNSSGSAGSTDPNEKIGPGYGAAGWVKADALLPYRINFENLGPGSVDDNGDPYPTVATAPAQRVTITDQLESSLDWSTFEITEFGFGDTVIHVPAGTSHYTGSVNTTYNDRTFRVALEAGIDFASGQIRVTFQSLALDSELPPDILTGFLPPEDGTGRGMGHFSYTIRTKANLPTNTRIRNVALIRFDINEVIATDQVDPLDASRGVDPDRQALVTVDADVPDVTVRGADGSSGGTSLRVDWAGSDVGSGIGGYDVYVSENGAAWERWLSGTAATSAIFEGTIGNTYRFAAVGRDNAGNAGPFDGTAQRSVTLVTAVYRPDLAVGKTAGSQIGWGQLTGRQRLKLVSNRTRPVRGTVAISNAGNSEDNIMVSGSKGNQLFKARYVEPGGNVTGSLTSGRYRTGMMSPQNAPRMIRVLIKPNKRKLKRRTRGGVRFLRKQIVLTFRGTSTAQPEKKDTVQIQTKVK